MTSPTNDVAIKRRSGRPSKLDKPYQTLAGDLARAIRSRAVERQGITWPSDRYRLDPVGFCRDILGYEPWERQVELLDAVRDHDRVGVCSGQKTSKTRTIASLALWWYCTTPGSQTILSSTTDRQLNKVVWFELQKLLMESGRCVECKRSDPQGPRPCAHSAFIDLGRNGSLARTGITSADGSRMIFGFTSREPEAVQGISGPNNLYLIDECSGVDDLVYEAIRGNLSGGGKIVCISNPTRNHGFFYEIFHDAETVYHRMSISSEESPNVIAGRTVIPGLATREYIAELEREYGRDSAFFMVRVLGKFCVAEIGRLFPMELIVASQLRIDDANDAGRLYLGVDPAGSGSKGDETAISVRRGLKQIALEAHTGLTANAVLGHVLMLIRAHKREGEIPVVVLDRDGAVGAENYGVMRTFVDNNPTSYKLVGVRGMVKPFREADNYAMVRDQVAASLERWIKSGGAILNDPKLAGELHVMRWSVDDRSRLVLIDKDEIRKILKRSSDRFDATALSVWEPTWTHDVQLPQAPPPLPPDIRVPMVDAYEMRDTWDPRRRR